MAARRFVPHATPLLTWRSGAALPFFSRCAFAKGVVVAGKLFVVGNGHILPVYDPQSNTWNGGLETFTNNSGNNPVTSACAHNGRFVVFLADGTALERADDDSWSPLEFAAALSDDDIVESVILG